MNKNDQEFLIQKIRTQYTEKESTELDALKKLDKKAKRPANTFAYIFGGIGAIIMGCGMSLVRKKSRYGRCDFGIPAIPAHY